MTPAELDDMRARLEKALTGRKLALLTPLPRSVRLRLWKDGKVDALACWLAEHGRFMAAVALWRASGQWDARR